MNSKLSNHGTDEDTEDEESESGSDEDEEADGISTKKAPKSTKASAKSTQGEKTTSKKKPPPTEDDNDNDPEVDDNASKVDENDNDTDKLKQQLKKLQSQLLQTQMNFKVAKRGGGRKVRKCEMTEEERKWSSLIYAAVKSYCINICKFINNGKKLDDATKVVFKAMLPTLKEFQGLKKKEVRKKSKVWIGKNRELVRIGMNEARNYCGSGARGLVITKMNKGEKVPTSDEFLLCLTRSPKLLETDEGLALFDEYVDVWLPKVALPEHWDKNFRHHQTVSKATHIERAGEFGTDHPCVTAGTEAFLQSFIKNGETQPGLNEKGETITYRRFEYIAQCKQNGNSVD